MNRSYFLLNDDIEFLFATVPVRFSRKNIGDLKKKKKEKGF